MALERILVRFFPLFVLDKSNHFCENEQLQHYAVHGEPYDNPSFDPLRVRAIFFSQDRAHVGLNAATSISGSVSIILARDVISNKTFWLSVKLARHFLRYALAVTSRESRNSSLLSSFFSITDSMLRIILGLT